MAALFMNLVLRFSCLACIILSGCTPATSEKPLKPTQTLPTVKDASFPKQKSYSSDGSDNLLNTLDPDVTSVEKAFDKAQLALAEGKSERAMFYYVKALQFEPKNTYALEQIAALHEQSNKPELALKVYQDIIKIDKDNVTANESLGLNYLKNRLYSQAQQHLSLATSQDESRWKAQNGLGVIADLQKEYSKAIGYYQKALASNPSSPMLLNNIGYSYYLSGDSNTARNYFNQALSFDSQYQRAIYNLALIEIKNQQYEAAVTLFNRIMPPYESYNNVGYICMINSQYAAAESYFRQAIDESPSYFPQAQANLEQLESLRSRE
jgi:Flp pilus assembly protein TadD